MISIQIPLFGIYKYVVEQLQLQLMNVFDVLDTNINELIDPRLHSRDVNGQVPKNVRNTVRLQFQKLRTISINPLNGYQELPTTDQLDEFYQALKLVITSTTHHQISHSITDILNVFD